MIFAYYTGAENCNYEQKEPKLSLGGIVSTTKVPKDLLNNLFSDISNYSLQKNSVDIKCIALKNESGIAINNVTIFIDSSDTTCDYMIAPVAPTINECGEAEFEKIGNSESSPYYATFLDANGIGNAINIGSILPNAVAGIWIKKQIKFSVINNLCANLDDDTVTKTETMKLNISWS